jgi:peptidoglycan/xylan/chitin deacetylase (PgdA/CDA1 family)
MPDAAVSVPARADRASGTTPLLIEASQPSLLCDYFRIPHRVAAAAQPMALPERHPLRGCAVLRFTAADGQVRSLYRPTEDAYGRSTGAASAGEFRLGDTPMFGRVVHDEAAAGWLRETTTTWTPSEPILDATGRRVASIWRDELGSVFLPFDPDEVVRNFWSEAYQELGGGVAAAPARAIARKVYYRVRPLLPRPTQVALRRAFRRVQERTRFPRWPLEPALDDLYGRIVALFAELAGEPLPFVAPWPDSYRSALVLTHDVETADGLAHIGLLQDLELAAGFRSSWNLVPERYRVPDSLVRELYASGFEVGIHGLRHDGLDLESLRRLRRRLPAMREHAERWDAVGFRAPALQRRWEWMPLLRFDYDSSYPDTDPYEPQPGGCCSLLPFFNGDQIELPVTLPQDHTMFVLLSRPDEALWIEKAQAVADRGGMALLITHPDYMLDEQRLKAYERFLGTYADDPAVWKPLPRELSAWWRRRSASRLENVNGHWTVVGPAAAEARVAFWPADGGTR